MSIDTTPLQIPKNEQGINLKIDLDVYNQINYSVNFSITFLRNDISKDAF